MKQIFSLDSPIMIFLGKIADMVILNLLFVFCSIPIITAGASATALCYVTLKARDGYEGSVCRYFFKSFRQNFLQATLIWSFLMVMMAALGINYRFIRAMEGTGYQLMRIILFIGVIIWIMLTLYVFFLQARFHNTVFQTLRNALALAVGNAPRCILATGNILAALLLTILTENTFWYGLLIWLVIGFSTLAKLNCYILCKQIPGLAPKNKDPQ